ncbi:hypothetical protein [Melghirimyces algeriensis]|uniref:hypothetical protein n=1 Tax=Melghirimyces algeriensis TaxID=910412 RepID=UPI00163D7580|nr:hypothetical protein [Melghirimyces algeriensis]
MLGVSQRTIETEYYIVDVPKIIKIRNQNDAVNKLFQIQVESFPYMEKRSQTALIEALQRDVGINQENTNFDRSKMDQLHAMYAQIQ